MAKGCRHRNVTGAAWPDAYPRWHASYKASATDLNSDALICNDCGEWLPLGPSNDVGVEHEIRAAEIVADRDPSRAPIEWCNLYEWFGFDSPNDAGVYRASPNAWLAGHLAREIVRHGEES